MDTKFIRRYRLILLLLVGLFWVYGVLYVFLIPPYQSPDEPTHLVRILHSANLGSKSYSQLEESILREMDLFDFWNRAGFSSPDVTIERFYEAPLLKIRPTQAAKAHLYYSLAGRIVSLMNHLKPVRALFVCRILGIGISSLILLICYMSTLVIWNNPRAGIMATILFFTPQFIYMSASVNPATLGWLWTSLVYFSVLKMIYTSHKIRYVSLGFLAMILGLLTHRTTLIALPILCIGIAIVIITGLKNQNRRPVLYLLFGLISIFMWSIISIMRPDSIRMSGVYLQKIVDHLNISITYKAFALEWWMHFGVMFNKSIWLAFGWLKYFGHRIYYFSMVVISGLLACRVLIAFFRSKHQKIRLNRLGIFIFTLTALFQSIAATFYFAVQGELSQGRYLFTSWLAFSVLWGIGATPFHFKKKLEWGRVVVFIAMVLMPLFALWFVLLPAFYF